MPAATRLEMNGPSGFARFERIYMHGRLSIAPRPHDQNYRYDFDARIHMCQIMPNLDPTSLAATAQLLGDLFCSVSN
jgi:hypothetical protein